jgi:FkbM family methyltransferase
VHRFINPNRAALDIGVQGMYTRHLSRYANGVFGFEANPDSANLAARCLRNVATIVPVALSDRDGFASLRIPIHGVEGAESALGTLSPNNALGGAMFRELTVGTRRLDEIGLPPVGFVKIDVEGHEEAVLRGGEQLLKRDRPIYMIEIEERHNSGSLKRIIAYFNEFGYEGSFFDGSAVCSIFELGGDGPLPLYGRLYINNFFFVPQTSSLP